MSKKKQSKRLIHIDLLNKTLNAQSENITSEQLSSVNKVIQILGFITNAEYANMYKIYGREEDDQFFADLTEFLIHDDCLLYTSPSPRDKTVSRMPSSA